MQITLHAVLDVYYGDTVTYRQEDYTVTSVGASEKTVDLDGLLKLAAQAEDIPVAEKKDDLVRKGDQGKRGKSIVQREKVRIGVAKDEAFCFIYEENLEALRRAGAEVCFFSPIHDAELPPELEGIVLYGGYPELFAERLSTNVSMRTAVCEAIRSGRVLHCRMRRIYVSA